MIKLINVNTEELSKDSEKWKISGEELTEKMVDSFYSPTIREIEPFQENYDLSIIICNYNTPNNYFNKCLSSLESAINDENIYKIQIIILNDKSTADLEFDKLSNLFDWYIINLSHNVGLGYARNIAFSYAEGTYLTLLDSDDFLSKGSITFMLEDAYSADYDAISYKHLCIDDDNNLLRLERDDRRSQKSGKFIIPWSHSSIIRTKIARKYGQYYCRRYEDSHGIVISHDIKNAKFNDSFIPYYYRQHPNSILHDKNYSARRWEMSLVALYALKEAKENYGLVGCKKEILSNYTDLVSKGYPEHLLYKFADELFNILKDTEYEFSSLGELIDRMNKFRISYDKKCGFIK